MAAVLVKVVRSMMGNVRVGRRRKGWWWRFFNVEVGWTDELAMVRRPELDPLRGLG